MGKPPPGDKSFGIASAIRYYDIEDRDDTEKGYEAEILVVYDSSLAAYKKNLIKRQFTYIDTFDHEGPVVINAMHNLTVGVFENLDIILPVDAEKRIAYTQHILRGAALKKIPRGSGDMQTVGKGACG